METGSREPCSRTSHRYINRYRIRHVFGLISLCGGIIPLCGGIASGLGVVLGLLSLKAERNKTAMAGIGISILGMIISVIYTFALMFNQ